MEKDNDAHSHSTTAANLELDSWRKPGEPGENPSRCRENMYTSISSWLRNQTCRVHHCSNKQLDKPTGMVPFTGAELEKSFCVSDSPPGDKNKCQFLHSLHLAGTSSFDLGGTVHTQRDTCEKNFHFETMEDFQWGGVKTSRLNSSGSQSGSLPTVTDWLRQPVDHHTVARGAETEPPNQAAPPVLH